jgi:hypothetical protein
MSSIKGGPPRIGARERQEDPKEAGHEAGPQAPSDASRGAGRLSGTPGGPKQMGPGAPLGQGVPLPPGQSSPGGTPARPAGGLSPERAAERAAEGLPQRKLSQAEAERFYSQAGFSRLGRKRGKGVELDDVTQGPIPLPVDEVDESAWDQSTLDDAQQEMTLQGAQLTELQARCEKGSESPPPVGSELFGHLVGIAFKPTEADLARLQALADAPPPPEVAMAAVHGHMASLFGLDVHALPAGPAMVAASLVVAGMSSAVQPEGDSLQAQPLAAGLQAVVERSNGAVEGARTMSSGISKQLALQRTFVFKR